MTDSRQPRGICSISVQGFKCLAEESSIEIRPLTILAGANSSGKSSIMQPLLLMKQTLEASYDPGPLLLNGPNVKLTSADQIVPRPRIDLDNHSMIVLVESPKDTIHRVTFSFSEDYRIQIKEMCLEFTDNKGNRSIRLLPGQKGSELHSRILRFLPDLAKYFAELPGNRHFSVHRDRCFLSVNMSPLNGNESSYPIMTIAASRDLVNVIHVPGLRGNPERVYDKTASGPAFPGTFEKYVASIIADWTESRDDRPKRLEAMLGQLGLTREISVRRLNEAQLEVRVGRMPGANSRGKDLVNVADVGFGVSQVLPVLVALLAADEGQLVYVEQPELHMHPRAQHALARIMVEAAKRGVRLVVETHSALLLLHVRTLLAQGEIDPDLVKLHWFSRDPEDGTTSIDTADLDEDGAFGGWPADFGDVELMAEAAYLDAVEKRRSEDGEAARS